MHPQATFAASVDELHAILQWIRHNLRGLDAKTIWKVELASEETVMNIIHHAYKQKSGNIEIEIRDYPKNRLEVVFRDTGPPFNPLEKEALADHETPLEEREVGGLGILLVRKTMDDVNYRREKNRNVLTLVKNYH